MIDKVARRTAAQIIRRFISGQLSNFDFENSIPSSIDPAILALEDTLWCFYDDFEEHKLSGKWSASDEEKALMVRWLSFLYSTEEYSWPKISHPGVRPIKYGFWGKLFKRDKKQESFMAAGEFSCWPYINKASYDHAKNNPVLLSGS